MIDEMGESTEKFCSTPPEPRVDLLQKLNRLAEDARLKGVFTGS
ncbi:MAG: hypothetical protein WCI71_13820 [Bacteroidota bacterium]